MGALLLFLFQATAISLSGVMAPGPMTAAAIAGGARRQHAGALMALGHGMVEFPLMVGIMAGMGVLVTSEAARAGVGLAGGVFLVLMGAGMLWKLREPETEAKMSGRGGPIIIGVALSAGNPFFLIWWATVGLTLAAKALELGVLAFALFAAVHWVCDLVWLEALSAAGACSVGAAAGWSWPFVPWCCWPSGWSMRTARRARPPGWRAQRDERSAGGSRPGSA